MILVEKVKIVKVSADFLRRLHESKEVELAPRRERLWQNARLNMRRNRKLRFDTLFLRRCFREIVDIRFQLVCHLVEAVGERFDLVAGLDVELLVEIAARDFPHARRQRKNRLHEAIRDLSAREKERRQKHQDQHRRPHQIVPEKGTQ